MDGDTTKVLLVTANVGSIFEEPAQMFQPWLKAFLQFVRDKEPGVVALHCQEVGGKNYEASMQHVNQFIKNLITCDELGRYDRARIFLDEDYTAADRFTALGNLYFIHEDVESVLIWDFVDCKFVAVEGREVLSGNIENVPIKEKAKFPQQFFPEFKWSRKGYLRTRWSVNNCIFDLVNVHLFHDASNIVAMETSPSLYCANRRRALLHTLQRFENDQFSKVPLFIFGDFNFRVDSCLLIKALTSKAVVQLSRGHKDQVNKLVYTEEGNGKIVLTVESKSFDFHDQHADLFSNTIKWLLQYDTELSSFQDRLFEYPINFPPSYPFTEDVSDGVSYMKTRVPSWCDRILLTHSAKDIISLESFHVPEYTSIGRDACMGDHKPVCLFLRMRPGKGNLTDQLESNVHKGIARIRGLSINGEFVPDPDIEAINIHDFAVFEKEHDLIPEFRASIKSRSSVSSGGGQSPVKLDSHHLGWEGEGFTLCQPAEAAFERNRSFQQIAQQVRVVERVLLRWPGRPRNRHHSSSSEDFCEDNLDTNENCTEVVNAQSSDSYAPVDTVFTDISAQGSHNTNYSSKVDFITDTSCYAETSAAHDRETYLRQHGTPDSLLETTASNLASKDTDCQTQISQTPDCPSKIRKLSDSQVSVKQSPSTPVCCESLHVVHAPGLTQQAPHLDAGTTQVKGEQLNSSAKQEEALTSPLPTGGKSEPSAPTPKAELSPLPGTSDIIIPSTQVKISEVDTTRYIHIRQGQSSTRVFRETSV